MAANRIAAALALLLFGATTADAQTERILDFLSDVELQPDSRLEVTDPLSGAGDADPARHQSRFPD